METALLPLPVPQHDLLLLWLALAYIAYAVAHLLIETLPADRKVAGMDAKRLCKWMALLAVGVLAGVHVIEYLIPA